MSDIRILARGSLAVVDERGDAIGVHIFDSSGAFVRTLPRVAGRGASPPPGPREIAVAPDGRIIVFDATLGGIFAYAGDSAGRFLAPFALPGIGDGPDPLIVTRGGTLHVRTSRFTPPPDRTPIPLLVRFRADGRLIDTIPFPELPVVAPPMMRATRGEGPNRMGVGNNVPYVPQMFVTFSPLGYFVTANTSRYAIDLLIPASWDSLSSPPPLWRAGDRVISIRRDGVQPVVVSEEERRSRRESLTASFRRVDSSWTWTGPDIPRVKPFFKRIAIGDDARLWVELSTPSDSIPNQPRLIVSLPSRSSGAPPTAPTVQNVGTVTLWRESLLYDVFEPDGTYLGQVSVPGNVTIRARRGDHVWGTRRDSARMTVHRFRITWR